MEIIRKEQKPLELRNSMERMRKEEEMEVRFAGILLEGEVGAYT